MQSLYSQVCVYELLFASKAHWVEWFLPGLSGTCSWEAWNAAVGASGKCQKRDQLSEKVRYGFGLDGR